MKNKIEAKIVADSLSPQGHRITTFLLTYPRFIHSELMTHRMFSRNSASSRAIPFEKMVKMVEDDPFIPIAWQKNHKGMQGTEYFDPNQSFRVEDFLESLKTLSDKIDVTLYHRIIGKYSDLSMTLPAWWLFTRDKVLEASILLNIFGVTKQICNRLLEPFMWHTVLVTATEYDNFFELRCPQYTVSWYPSSIPEALEPNQSSFKSRKDAIKYTEGECNNWREQDWRDSNESQAEIHIQALAEAMWDAMNESTPKQLESGQWHIPFGDNIDITTKSKIVSQENNRLIEKYDNPMSFSLPTIDLRDLIEPLKVKISTARCARLSYMTFDGEIDYQKDIELHDRLLASHHMSPFEHCARAMNEEEYDSFIKGEVELGLDTSTGGWGGPPNITYHPNKNIQGWCNNFRGFISYRYLIENN